jgi:hypothetical protein
MNPHPDPEPDMTSLLKSALIVLTLGLATCGSSTGAAGPEPPLATAMKQHGHAAVVAIERDIHARMLETSRRQLEVTLPAELAATPAQGSERPVALVARAEVETRTASVVVARRGGSADSGERAALRWQSLLPGMMK